MNSQKIEKYDLKNVELVFKSNYGIIYKGVSKKYGKIIIKKNLDKKNYYDSCKYYSAFKEMCLCKMYAINNDYNVQMFEYIAGRNLFTIPNFMERIKMGYNYFYDWSKHLKTLNNGDDISFKKMVYTMIKHLKKMTLSEDALKLMRKFETKANHFFKTYNNLYLLHGDLQHYNMLYDGKKVIAIDLSPLQASFAIEIAKFIENELFNNLNEIFQMLNAFLLVFKFEIINDDELLEGLFIDSCYRTFDSFIESGNQVEFEKGVLMNDQILEYIERRKNNEL